MAASEITVAAVLGDGRYRLESRLGAGGMASVWLAHDERLARRVAVKVMSDTLAGDEHYRERFSREARAAASVSHPSIVPVYDYGLADVRPFLVMEYVSGGSLADLLDGQKSMALDGVEVAGRLLSALDCVHRAGLVHRDVKPANILLDPSGRPRLTDFGIARPEDASSLTQTGMVVGTLRYLAPEVGAGGAAGPAADLYAAGVVLRELTNQQPAPQLTSLIAALTAGDPSDRPASAHTALGLLGLDKTPAARTAPTRLAPTTAATTHALHRTTGQTRRITEHTRPVAKHTRRMARQVRARLAARGISSRAALAAAAAVLLVLSSSSVSPPMAAAPRRPRRKRASQPQPHSVRP